jgi:3-methyladenine DNA glycosylase/8-oxoguanine DNA glycosylase
MNTDTPPSDLLFDLAEATRHLSERDAVLRELIADLVPFRINLTSQESPYEVLLRSITYQSISGKAAKTIFERIKTTQGGTLARQGFGGEGPGKESDRRNRADARGGPETF